jgi:DNA polymerase III alpha subunit (gram-positive type)
LKYIAFDAETGGLLAKDHSLLTLYLAVTDENFNIVDDLDLKIRPEGDGYYCLTSGAMSVNKIDIVQHDKEAIPVSEATKKLYMFLKRHSDDGKSKLSPIGHNVPFDEEFITNHLLKRSVWNTFVGYHKLDTATIAQFLKLKGKLDRRASIRLGELAKALKINVKESNLHGAKYDTMLCIEILKAMVYA